MGGLQPSVEAYGVLCDRLDRCLPDGLDRTARDVTPDLRGYPAAKVTADA
jgi:hypothetical protein